MCRVLVFKLVTDSGKRYESTHRDDLLPLRAEHGGTITQRFIKRGVS